MIEKLKPQTYRKVKDGVAIYTGIEDTEEYIPPLSPAEQKINEIIDIVNATAQVVHDWPFTPKEAPKKRTAREIVQDVGLGYEALCDGSDHMDGVIEALEKVIKAFDREGIE